MKWLPSPLLPALLLLAACAGRAPPPPPRDEALLQRARAAQLALQADRAEEAARLYQQALDRARERDDAEAIGETGTGLAAARLAQGQHAAALATAQELRLELARRGGAAPASLRLIEAVALFRAGDLAAADAAAAELPPGDADASARAAFLRGLIAARRGDAAALASARTALGVPQQAAFRADAEELEARAALLAGDAATAGRLALDSAATRREALDYRGLARALALAAEAAERGGDRAAAADLYLRAGRGAAARAEQAEARAWLARAEALARETRQPELAAAARAGLGAIPAAGRAAR